MGASALPPPDCALCEGWVEGSNPRYHPPYIEIVTHCQELTRLVGLASEQAPGILLPLPAPPPCWAPAFTTTWLSGSCREERGSWCLHGCLFQLGHLPALKPHPQCAPHACSQLVLYLHTLSLGIPPLQEQQGSLWQVFLGDSMPPRRHQEVPVRTPGSPGPQVYCVSEVTHSEPCHCPWCHMNSR